MHVPASIPRMPPGATCPLLVAHTPLGRVTGRERGRMTLAAPR
jgi:hypothetical protein